jgi:SAM-dependent methyltransferase
VAAFGQDIAVPADTVPPEDSQDLLPEGAAAWDHYAAAYQAAARLPTSVAFYGPDIPNEAELRLLGDLRGKRVLELGCGGGQASISFVKQGAAAIGVDFSAEQLAYARRECDAEEVRVELRQGDVADLAFMRADSIDLVFSSYVFHYVEDLNRVFRQVHRVLKVGAPLVFSIPHPMWNTIDATPDAAPPMVGRPYFDRSPIRRRVPVPPPVAAEATDVQAGSVGDGGSEEPPQAASAQAGPAAVVLTEFPRTFSDLYLGLARASYRVDLVLEPPPVTSGPRSADYRPAMTSVPRTLIVRARKEGN